MRKIILILAVLTVTCPAWADVEIYCIPSADPMIIGPVPVDVMYDMTTEPVLVRAFALDITVDSGASIAGVDDVSAQYNIHPGSFGLDEFGNPVGSVVASPEYPGTLPGGPEGVTSEQASLYIGAANEPNDTGKLFTIYVSSIQDCNLFIAANVIRAGSEGVVMEDTNPPDGTVNYSPCHLTARCWCGGDVTVTGSFVPVSPGDGIVNIFDMITLANYLQPPPLFSKGPPVAPGYECGDVQTTGIAGLPAVGPDDVMNIFDMIALANWLMPTDPLFTQPCVVIGVAEAPEPPEE